MSQSFRDKASKACQDLENIPKFLKIVYQMLEDGRYEEYIGWSHDGRAIVIKKPVEFAEKLLPIYFKHSNYSSFVRQLNLYSFRKKKNYPFDNVFAHTMFVRGRRDLLKYVKRKNSNVNQQDKAFPRVDCSSEDEATPDYEDVLRENTSLKKVHEDMSERLDSCELKIRELAEDNDKLHQQYLKKKANEDFLKTVITKLAKVHGVNAVKDVIESINSNKNPVKSNYNQNQVVDNGYTLYSFEPAQKNMYGYSHQIESEPDLHENKIFMAKHDPSFINSSFLRTVSTASTNVDIADSTDSYQDFDPRLSAMLIKNKADSERNAHYNNGSFAEDLRVDFKKPNEYLLEYDPNFDFRNQIDSFHPVNDYFFN